MPDQTVEEMLAALAEGEEQEAPSQEPKETNAMRQVREALKRAKATEAELRAERDQLAETLQAKVEAETTAALQSAGLSPRQAEVFRKAYDSVTPENISAFKAEVLGQAEEGAPAVFAPLVLNGGEAPTKRYTRQEFESIMRSNPAQGTQIAEAGLVDWDTRAHGHAH